MAILRNTPDADNPISYVASAAFFCCVSMVMLGLFGFYAKIKVASKRTKDEDVPVVCISGAYRSKNEDFFESGNLPALPKKITPSMVTLPPSNNSMKPSKSTNDMREPQFRPVMLNKSTPDISLDPRGGTNHNAEVELRNPKPKPRKREENNMKKLDKKRKDEQKAREKAAQDLAKKQAKEKAKQEKEQAKLAKLKDQKGKTKAPKAPPMPLSPPSQNLTGPTTSRQPFPSDTLRSDINRSSGPPPYSELPDNEPPKASTSNVSFGKPINNTSSWDMVSQHRQQMSRPTATIGGAKKQMVMDLQYNPNIASDKDNSEA